MLYIIEHFPKHTTPSFQIDFLPSWQPLFPHLLQYALNLKTCRDLKLAWEKGNLSQRTFHHFYFSVKVTLLSGNEVEEKNRHYFETPLFGNVFKDATTSDV